MTPHPNRSLADRPIKFLDMDDLHPDFIYERVDLFREFRQLKTKLKSRDHFAAAADEIQSWSGQTQTIHLVGDILLRRLPLRLIFILFGNLKNLN